MSSITLDFSGNYIQIILPVKDYTSISISWFGGSPIPYSNFGTDIIEYSGEVVAGTVTVTGDFTTFGLGYNLWAGASSLLSVTSWSGLTNLSGAFNCCTSLTSVPELPPTVTNTSYMFTEAITFNGDISNWNTHNVTDTSYMFESASTFNSNLPWDVSAVVNAEGMFSDAIDFSGNGLELWDVRSMTDVESMFDDALGCYSNGNFTKNLTQWNISAVTSKSNFFNINNTDTTLSDLNSPFTYMELILNHVDVTLPIFDITTSIEVDWGNGSKVSYTSSSDVSGTVTGPVKIYGSFGTFGTGPNPWPSAPDLSAVTQWGPVITNLSGAFNGCTNLTSVPALPPTVTNTSFMFYGATAFTGNGLELWNVTNVTDMTSMFEKTSGMYINENLNISLIYWNINNVIEKTNFIKYSLNTSDITFTDPLSPFNPINKPMILILNNINVTLPISDISSTGIEVDWGDGNIIPYTSSPVSGNVTGPVRIYGSFGTFGSGLNSWPSAPDLFAVTQWGLALTNLSGAFYGCTNLTSVPELPPTVTNTSYMFAGAITFNGDISNWNTHNVTDMTAMFYNASTFNSNLPWDVSAVVYATGMFAETIDFSGNGLESWDVRSMTDVESMFDDALGCYSNGNFTKNLTQWNISAVTYKSYFFNINNTDTTLSDLNSPFTYMELILNHVDVTLPISDISSTGIEVDWGNGSKVSYTSSFDVSGTVSGPVKIYGKFGTFGTGPNPWLSAPDLSAVTQWGPVITNLSGAFNGCTNLTSVPKLPFTVTNTSYMFYGATAFTGTGLGQWNVTNVTDMTSMFERTSGMYTDENLNISLIGWNINNVIEKTNFINYNGTSDITFTDPLSPFNPINNLMILILNNINVTLPISDISSTGIEVDWGNGTREFYPSGSNVSGNVTGPVRIYGSFGTFGTGSSLWLSASELQSVLQWGLSLTNLSGAFNGCTNLTSVPKLPPTVTNTSYMFAGATKFNGDISNWNTHNVTDMAGMFGNASAFNGDISNWNTHNVTDMAGMFTEAITFNGDISNWNTRNVTDMAGMFINASTFNSNLPWDVSAVINASEMFRNTTDFSGNGLELWDVRSMTDVESMFYNALGCYSNGNFTKNLTQWNTSVVRNKNFFNINNKDTTLSDPNSPFLTMKLIFRNPVTNPVTLPISDISSTGIEVDWGNGTRRSYTSSSDVSGTVTGPVTIYGSFGTFGTGPNPWPSAPDLFAVTQWGISLTNLSGAFNGCINLTSVVPLLPLTVTNTSYMFKGASVFTGTNVNLWDVTNVTDMSYMFMNAIIFGSDYDNDVNLGQWADIGTTEYVKNMSHMFDGTQEFFGDQINKWDVSEVTDMSYMFANSIFNCSNLGNWTPIKVKNMSHMFAYGLYIGGGGYNVGDWYSTNNVTDMSNMFKDAKFFNSGFYETFWLKLKGNLAGMFDGAESFVGYDSYIFLWDVSDVTDMSNMFRGALDCYTNTDASGQFTSDISKWNVSAVTSKDNFFNINNTDTTLSDPNSPFNPINIPMILILNHVDVTLPISNITTSIEVDWGNGTRRSYTSSSDVSGTVTGPVTIYGKFGTFGSGPSPWPSAPDLSAVTQWGLALTNLSGAFNGCINLTSVPELPPTVTNTSYMFAGATKFNGDISNWNTHNVTDMTAMFVNASTFNSNLPWDVSAVVNATGMFVDTIDFSGNGLELWDVRSMTNVEGMFENALGCYNNTDQFTSDISKWNVSAVTNKSNFFRINNTDTTLSDPNSPFNPINIPMILILNHVYVTLPISDISSTGIEVDWGDGNIIPYTSSFDVSGTVTGPVRIYGSFGTFGTGLNSWPSAPDLFAVTQWGLALTNLSGAFNGCTNLTSVPALPSTVTNTSYMFASTFDFTGNGLELWDVSGVTDMQFMFAGATKFNVDLSYWAPRVGNVQTMAGMFSGATDFSGNGLESWDVSGVTDMQFMFRSATKFNVDLSYWATRVGNVQTMAGMFFGATDFSGNGLESWDVSKVTDMQSMFQNASKCYSNGQFTKDLTQWNVNAVTNKINFFNYDNSLDTTTTDLNSPFTFMELIFNNLVNNVELPISDICGSIEVDWGDGNRISYSSSSVSINGTAFGPVRIYGSFGTFGTGPNPWIRALDLTAVTQWGPGITNLSGAFNGCSILTSVPALPSTVTNTSYMFFGAVAFNGNIELWDVSGVTDMQFMFRGATKFNVDLSYWATRVGNVQTMAGMFFGATDFSGNGLELWDISEVTDMSFMFRGATKFNANLSYWAPRVGNVQTMNGMFFGATDFTGNGLELWDVSGVANMAYMFISATKFNVDLSYWATRVGNVQTMEGMFAVATDFSGNGLESWNVSKVTNMDNMFNSASKCYSNGQFTKDLTQWNVNAVTTKINFFNYDDSLDTTYVDLYSPFATFMELIFNTVTDVELPISNIYGSIKVDWGDSNRTPDISSSNVTGPVKVYGSFGTFGNGANSWTGALDLSAVTQWGPGITNLSGAFNGCSILTSVPALPSTVTNTSYMFASTFDFSGNGLELWDVTNVTDMQFMFQYATKFNANLSYWAPRVGNVQTMDSMFAIAFEFTGNGLELWDVSEVTDMSNMFASTKFNVDLSEWATRVGNVQTMDGMFAVATDFSGNGLELWNVSEVTDMSNMFASTKFNVDLSEWAPRVGNVQTMAGMFAVATDFTGNGLESWDVSKVTNMDNMFNSASKCYSNGNFTKNLIQWNVSAVTSKDNFFNINNTDTTLSDPNSPFSYMELILNHVYVTLPISNITTGIQVDWGDGNRTPYTSSPVSGTVTGPVRIYGSFGTFGTGPNPWPSAPDLSAVTQWGLALTNLSGAFSGCTNLTSVPELPPTVTNTSYMFAGATKFNGDISNWNTHNVTDMTAMFVNASTFNSNLPWDVSAVVNAEGMFSETIDFSGNGLESWDVRSMTDVSFMFDNALGCYNNTDQFTSDISKWNVSAVTSKNNFFRINNTDTTLSDPNSPFNPINIPMILILNHVYVTLPISDISTGIEVDWGNGTRRSYTSSSDVSGTVTGPVRIYGSFGTFGTGPNPWPSAPDLFAVTQWGLALTNLGGAFNGCTNLTSVPGLPSTVTNTSYMFYGATIFNGDIGNWNVTNVENMSNMFNGAVTFEGNNIDQWDVSGVTDMSSMFERTTSCYTNDLFNIDLTSWNITSVLINNTINPSFFFSPTGFYDTTFSDPKSPFGLSPKGVTAVGYDSSASITWTAPTGTVTGYDISSNPATTLKTSSSTSFIFTDLTNGTSYTFRVTAKFGQIKIKGRPSNPSNSVIPGIPGTPTDVTAVAYDSSASITWTAPAGTVTEYDISSNPATTLQSSIGTSFIFTGLTNGTSYTFTVTAKNGLLKGTASNPSNSVTPFIPNPLFTDLGTYATQPNPAFKLGSKIYGTFGTTLFSIDGQTYAVLETLSGTAIGSLNRIGDTLYGTTNNSVFAYDTSSAILRTVGDLTSATGYSALDLFGNIYVTDSTGVYKITSTTMTKISTEIIQGALSVSNNVLYGIRSIPQLNLTITKNLKGLNLSTFATTTTTLTSSVNSDSAVVDSRKVYFYGTSNNQDIINSYSLTSQTYTTLWNFDANPAKGTAPIGRILIDSSSQVLYGICNTGGAGAGTLYSYNLRTSTMTVLVNYGQSNGTGPLSIAITREVGNAYVVTGGGDPNITPRIRPRAPATYILGQINLPTFVVDCFNHGTKILRLLDDQEVWSPIETLRVGDLVKSYKHGYRAIIEIGKGAFINNPNLWHSRMYVGQHGSHEPLYITGGHGLLVDYLTQEEEKAQSVFWGRDEQIIDDKILMVAPVSTEFKGLDGTEVFTYYHFVLENDGDANRRYGVWANGFLTETPSLNLFRAGNLHSF